MPRVFNAIRRQLLKAANFERYLLYAIGEIVLIVAGIFIAVQLNDKNEVRKDRIKEQTVLVSLGEDFRANIAMLDSALITYAHYTNMIESCMNYTGLGSYQMTRKIKDTILLSTKHIHTSLVTGTLNSVLTSDKLELIENEKLKSLLTAYLTHVDGFYDTQSKVEFVILNRHRPILEEFLSLVDILSDRDKRYSIIKTRGVKSNYTGLLKSLKYQNALIDRSNMEHNLIEDANLMRFKTKEILDILEKETAVN